MINEDVVNKNENNQNLRSIERIYDSDLEPSKSPLKPIFPLVSSSKKDSIWGSICIFLLSWSLAYHSVDRHDALKYVYPGMGYPQFVSVSRTLLRGTAEDIKKKIVNIILSLIPDILKKKIFQFCTNNPQWISEKSSQFVNYGLLAWLVGPVERIQVKIPQSDGSSTEWLSGVKVKECRYLVESGCKSACLHLCKGPTQAFFNEELGLKVYMKPDFKDCSCEMQFGVPPPSSEADPSYGEPCFSTCSMMEFKSKKPKNKKILPSTENHDGSDLNTDPSNDQLLFNKCT
jgi:hypothetical protein